MAPKVHMFVPRWGRYLKTIGLYQHHQLMSLLWGCGVRDCPLGDYLFCGINKVEDPSPGTGAIRSSGAQGQLDRPVATDQWCVDS